MRLAHLHSPGLAVHPPLPRLHRGPAAVVTPAARARAPAAPSSPSSCSDIVNDLAVGGWSVRQVVEHDLVEGKPDADGKRKRKATDKGKAPSETRATSSYASPWQKCASFLSTRFKSADQHQDNLILMKQSEQFEQLLSKRKSKTTKSKSTTTLKWIEQ